MTLARQVIPRILFFSYHSWMVGSRFQLLSAILLTILFDFQCRGSKFRDRNGHFATAAVSARPQLAKASRYSCPTDGFTSSCGPQESINRCAVLVGACQTNKRLTWSLALRSPFSSMCHLLGLPTCREVHLANISTSQHLNMKASPHPASQQVQIASSRHVNISMPPHDSISTSYHRSS